MNITVTVNYGPIEAEISGDNREEVQQELVEFIDFFNENQGNLELDISTTGRTSSNEHEMEDSDRESEDEHPLALTARELSVSVTDIDKVVYIDPDLEENPQLLVDAGALGESTVEQQRRAAYILLYIWDEIYDNGRMETSLLKDLLQLNGVSISNLSRAWKNEGEGEFDPQGRGPSASVSLTGVGSRTAKTVLKELAS